MIRGGTRLFLNLRGDRLRRTEIQFETTMLSMDDIEELIEMDEGRERELDETMYLNRDKDD